MKCEICGNAYRGGSQRCGLCGAFTGQIPVDPGPMDIGTLELEIPDVSFAEAIKLGLRRTFNFHGRARRSEYIWWSVFNGLMPVGFVASLRVSWHSAMPMELVSSALLLLCVIFFIPSISLSVRRLHDVGSSGWFLLWGVIPLIGAFALMLHLMLPGNRGQNKYGPDPRQVGVSQK